MTYVRDTSIEAYEKIIANGLLGEMQTQVYKILYKHGPLTGAQVSLIMKRDHWKSDVSETVRNRLGELRDRGVARELGKVKCPVTKNTVYLYDVTSGLPFKPMNRPKKERRNEALSIIDRVMKTELMSDYAKDDLQHCYFLVMNL